MIQNYKNFYIFQDSSLFESNFEMEHETNMVHSEVAVESLNLGDTNLIKPESVHFPKRLVKNLNEVQVDQARFDALFQQWAYRGKLPPLPNMEHEVKYRCESNLLLMAMYTQGKSASLSIWHDSSVRSAQPFSVDPHWLAHRLTDTQKAFYEVVRRLDPKQIIDIINKIKISNCDYNALTEGRVEALNDPNFHYNALAALYHGAITQQQYGTLLVFKRRMSYQNDVVALTIPGKQDKHYDLIRQGLKQSLCRFMTKNPIQDQDALKGPKHELLTEQEWTQFFDQLDLLPDSERQFLIGPDIDKGETLNRRITFGLGLNLFSRVMIGKQIFRITPSLGMIQTFLNIVSREKDKPVVLNPVLGVSSVYDIRESGLRRKRDVALSSPFAPMREKEDSFLVFGPDFEEHDAAYHGYLEACIPAAHAEHMIRTADQLLGFRPSPAGKFWYQLTSLEDAPFRRDLAVPFNAGSFFWRSIAHKFVYHSLPNQQKVTRQLVRFLISDRSQQLGIDLDSLNLAIRAAHKDMTEAASNEKRVVWQLVREKLQSFRDVYIQLMIEELAKTQPLHMFSQKHIVDLVSQYTFGEKNLEYHFSDVQFFKNTRKIGFDIFGNHDLMSFTKNFAWTYLEKT